MRSRKESYVQCTCEAQDADAHILSPQDPTMMVFRPRLLLFGALALIFVPSRAQDFPTWFRLSSGEHSESECLMLDD
jgi:hypothetical protein